MMATITTNLTNKINKRQESTMDAPPSSSFDAAITAIAVATKAAVLVTVVGSKNLKTTTTNLLFIN
jgi:hypothetical protein